MDGRHILIVDDDEATCAVLSLALTSEGYRCRLAHSLAEALGRLRDGPPPDLILLDLLLPDASGELFLQHLALNAAWSKIPVIIMSAWGKAGEVASSARLELLPKPFSLAEAERLVRRHLYPRSSV